MSTRITIKVPTNEGLKDKTGYLMDVNSSKEPWSEYELEDGARIRVKQSIIQIVKLDEKDPVTGDPVYTVQAQPIISVIPPQGK